MESRTDQIETSRLVILSSARGMVTEYERLQTDTYILRYHKSSAEAGIVFDSGAWIGFRYSDAHWSFVKQ